LPPDHHEEQASARTTEGIEAFLEGPTRARRPRRRHLRPANLVRPRAVIPLDTPPAWEQALRHEDRRVVRYGRPASVLVVDIVAAITDLDRTGSHPIDRQVTRIGTVIRAQARETDRVVRIGPCRYEMLLPETDEQAATALAARIVDAWTEAEPAPTATIVTAVASPTGGGSLADALRLARARLAS
jgi:GGDEF domain-containing protein